MTGFELDKELTKAAEAHRAGDPAGAEPIYRQVLDVRPEDAETWHLLGVARLQQGDPAGGERCVRRAIELAESQPKYRNTLANILNATGRTEDALAALDEALGADPDFTDAAYNKGTLLLLLARHEEAEQVFRGLLDQGLDGQGVRNNFATSLLRQYKTPEAVAACREGLALFPEAPDLITTTAYALEAGNQLSEAEALLPRLETAEAALPLASVLRARILRRLKRAGEAWEAIRAVNEDALPPSDRIEALYEKGMVLDALGTDDAAAFHYIKTYNDLLAKSPEAAPCDGELFLERARAYRDWAEALPPKPSAPPDPNAPVFFVGFPRSGTTLMEHVLKAHPKVVTTEEISPLAPVEVEARRLAENEGTAYPHCLNAWGDARFADLRRLFWAEAEKIVGPRDGRLLVDKLPLNLVSLGLAAKLWPGARVLTALRDPRDSCLSCYVQRFKLNNAMACYLDVELTGRAYAEVMGLWLCYRETLGLPFHEYRYEDLVVDFEGVVRPVLEFLGVGWHDEVANYREKSKARNIRTPSYRQVTDKLHTGAVARWRRFEEGLAPMLPHLAPFVERFGYNREP